MAQKVGAILTLTFSRFPFPYCFRAEFNMDRSSNGLSGRQNPRRGLQQILEARGSWKIHVYRGIKRETLNGPGSAFEIPQRGRWCPAEEIFRPSSWK